MESGSTLFDVLRNNGIGIPSSCSGKGTCGKCKVIVNGKEEKACEYTVTADVTLELPKTEEIKSRSSADYDSISEDTYILVDLGSTNIVLEQVYVQNNQVKIIGKSQFKNPQASYGADIISRVEFGVSGGKEKLHKVIVKALEEEIIKLNAVTKIYKVRTIYVSGNSVMMALFLNKSLEPFATAPFEGISHNGVWLRATDIGIGIEADIYCTPSVSGFIGGDLLSGVRAVLDICDRTKNSLFIDIGTNTEIAFITSSVIYASAAPAGPCFEGANISHGMSCNAGAVYRYKLSRDKNGFKSDIGIVSCCNSKDLRPRGICGTGLVDIAAEFLDNLVIDTNGTYTDGNNRFRIIDNIYLTQEDIREFQKAKAAISAVIYVLLNRDSNVKDQSLDVYITGAFGENINIDNFIKVGFVPFAFAENMQFKTIENANIAGLHALVLKGTDEIEKIKDMINSVNAAQIDDFQNIYISEMDFNFKQ